MYASGLVEWPFLTSAERAPREDQRVEALLRSREQRANRKDSIAGLATRSRPRGRRLGVRR
jgi:hypothetical protein